MTRRVCLVAVCVLCWGAVSRGAIQQIIGFEVGNENELWATGTGSTGTGTAATQGTTKRSGDYAFRTNCPATTDTCYGSFRTPNTGGTDADTLAADRYTTMYVRFGTLPAANDEPIYQTRNSSDVVKGELRINSAGHLAAYNSTAVLLATGTATLTTGVWYCLQVLTGTGSPAAFEVKVDNVSDITTTGNMTVASNARMRLGKGTNRNSQAIDIYFDDIVADNAAFQNCGQSVLRMDVDGDGTSTAWTIGAGGGADYTNVDDVPSDGSTTYLLSTSVDADASSVSLESSASAGITGAITSVKAFGFFRRDNTAGSTQGTVQFGIRSNAVDSLGVDSSINPGTVGNYDSRQLIFDTNPDGNIPWELATLDGLEVVAVEAETADKTRLTAMTAHVLFTPTAGGGGGAGLRRLLLLGLGAVQ